MSSPSVFQKRIEGEWIGRPSLFDGEGTWRGFEDIRRSSVFADGETTYYMDGGLSGGGDMAGRFALGAPFAFGVRDSDADRLYTGPDFYGSGQPYGGFVDANYYGPGWQVSLNTWNHTVGDTQIYSSVLYQGPAMVGVFNGLYTRDPEREQRHLEHETRCGAVPFIVPTKQNSCYAGDLDVWSAAQKPLGGVRAELLTEPVDLLVSRRRLGLRGVLELDLAGRLRRDGVRTFYEGPGAWGNANSYGRANFVRLHTTDGRRIAGREFMMDAEPGMGAGHRLALVYQLFEHNSLSMIVHGVLERA
ncbi:hypothetical protein [Nocardia alni]|uniref:hypothetical protein n=1 Tax=Nocardia alni TaxID=2815723 RepID=UPI001C2103A5|nr:hypothetical protein [Nocardia alni]